MSLELKTTPETYFPDLINCILGDCKKIRHLAKVLYHQDTFISERSLYKDDDDHEEKELAVVVADAPVAQEHHQLPMKNVHMILPAIKLEESL